MVLHIKAKPASRENRISRLEDGTLQVRIKAPAQDGKANAALISYLSTIFKVPKSSISLQAGSTSVYKKIAIPSLTDPEGMAILEAIVA
jgi:uncharacterized protein